MLENEFQILENEFQILENTDFCPHWFAISLFNIYILKGAMKDQLFLYPWNGISGDTYFFITGGLSF